MRHPRHGSHVNFGRARASLIAVILVALSSVAMAQNDKSRDSSISTFKSRSQLVMVPVVVKDHHGAHVSGLTKDDFVVKENGSPQRITVFEEIKTSSAPVRHTPQNGETQFSNFASFQSGQPASRIVILALDTINTPVPDQFTAKKHLIKFLSENLNSDALISLVEVTRSGVKVIHDFTTNPAVLVAALNKVRGKAPELDETSQLGPQDDSALQSEVSDLTELQQGIADSIAEEKRVQIVHTLDAMQQIAQRYAGVPGRKSLIWATAGFPFSIGDTDALLNGTLNTSSGLQDILPQYQHTWELFNDANIAVYPVDVRGLVNSSSIDASMAPGPRGLPKDWATRQSLHHQDQLDSFRNFADMTGGEAFYDSNDLAKSFREAEQDSASYYMLGYYLDRNAKPGWHTLKVGVHRSGITARSRSGFLIGSSADDAVHDNDIAEALSSPMDFSALPLTVRWDSRVRSNNATKTRVGFDITFAANVIQVDDSDNDHISFEVIALAKSPDGKPVGDTSRKVNGHLTPENAAKLATKGLTYNQSIDLPPGSYTVRIVVRDNLSGRIGSVSAPLDIK